jgi:hypothetical protein
VRDRARSHARGARLSSFPNEVSAVYDNILMAHSRAAAASTVLPISLLALVGCGKSLPTELEPAVDAALPVAIQVAATGATLCSSMKDRAPFQPHPLAAPPPPASPAAGTALASDARVVNVLVGCSWPDPRDATGNAWGGTAFPRLNGKSAVPVRPVTMPSDIVQDTCAKNRHDCQQIIVPSRYVASGASADLRVVRPTPDGGEVEVVVVVIP